MASTAVPTTSELSQRALERFAAHVAGGEYRRAAVADPQSGDVADAELRALYAALPTISPTTELKDLVAHKLLPSYPKGHASIDERPRYFPEREVLLRTTLKAFEPTDEGPFGVYDPEGVRGYTHLARLRSRMGDDFVVEVEGANKPLVVPKLEVLAANEPTGVQRAGGAISGVGVDYSEGLLKAHICAAYLELGEKISALDFTQDDAVTTANQVSLIRALLSRMDMAYPGQREGYSGTKPGGLFRGGIGVCFVQRAVAAIFLQAFASALGIEQQVAVGRTIRRGAPHGFNIITLQPSMRRFICDPAWGEPATDIRVAFFDGQWGHDRTLIGFEGSTSLDLAAHDINLPEIPL